MNKQHFCSVPRGNLAFVLYFLLLFLICFCYLVHPGDYRYENWMGNVMHYLSEVVDLDEELVSFSAAFSFAFVNSYLLVRLHHAFRPVLRRLVIYDLLLFIIILIVMAAYNLLPSEAEVAFHLIVSAMPVTLGILSIVETRRSLSRMMPH